MDRSKKRKAVSRSPASKRQRGATEHIYSNVLNPPEFLSDNSVRSENVLSLDTLTASPFENHTTLASTSELVSKPNADLDLKSVPAKLLSTEEDLLDDDEDGNMVIVESDRHDELCDDDEVNLEIVEDSNLSIEQESGNNNMSFQSSQSPYREAEEDSNVMLHEEVPLSCQHPVRIPFTFPGQSFNIQAQKLIVNVWNFFKRARKDPSIMDNLKGPQDHAAACLNVGTKTIGKIVKRVVEFGKFEVPGQKRQRPKTVLDTITPEGEQILRQIIKDMNTQRICPTVPLVMEEARNKLNFKGSNTSFRRILKRMGIVYEQSPSRACGSRTGWKEKEKQQIGPKKLRKKKEDSEIQIISATNVAPPTESEVQSEIVQPHEVIFHYQKPEDGLLSTSHPIIVTAGESSEIIHLQLTSSGEHVNVVPGWHWQNCPPTSTDVTSQEVQL